jgi:hypothetical protein
MLIQLWLFENNDAHLIYYALDEQQEGALKELKKAMVVDNE